MALVQFMLPGLAFFYAGLLHRRSVITMIMQNFASMGVIFVLWFFVVFSLCFGETWHFFGSILTYPCFLNVCLLYTSPSPRDGLLSRMPSSA